MPHRGLHIHYIKTIPFYKTRKLYNRHPASLSFSRCLSSPAFSSRPSTLSYRLFSSGAESMFLRLPTLALSKSGLRVEGHTFLSACPVSKKHCKLPAVQLMHLIYTASVSFSRLFFKNKKKRLFFHLIRPGRNAAEFINLSIAQPRQRFRRLLAAVSAATVHQHLRILFRNHPGGSLFIDRTHRQ